jgi:hypothetical protein
MISVNENIKACKDNINQLMNQRNDITSEILRIEGALRVFMDMEKAGVTEIPVSKNPLETTEVIDAVDVQASGPEPEQ